jgi:hypothetical protein
MKFPVLAVATILTIVAGACKKDNAPMQTAPPSGRKVLYELYTDQDFSTDLHNITFTLHMINMGTRKTYDSSLATMQIKDIPDFAHRISIEKLVPANITNNLTDSFAVSFVYAEENVGVSWHTELFPAGDTLKLIRFNFR